MHRWIKMTTEEPKKYKVHGKDLILPVYGYRYMGAEPNSYSNAVVKTVEYHIDTFPIFQDIIDASGTKVNYVGWLSIHMNEDKCPLICMI